MAIAIELMDWYDLFLYGSVVEWSDFMRTWLRELVRPLVPQNKLIDLILSSIFYSCLLCYMFIQGKPPDMPSSYLCLPPNWIEKRFWLSCVENINKNGLLFWTFLFVTGYTLVEGPEERGLQLDPSPLLRVQASYFTEHVQYHKITKGWWQGHVTKYTKKSFWRRIHSVQSLVLVFFMTHR